MPKPSRLTPAIVKRLARLRDRFYADRTQMAAYHEYNQMASDYHDTLISAAQEHFQRTGATHIDFQPDNHS